MNEIGNDLERLIALSKVVAKPWVIATWVLAGLLALSVAGNVYLSLNGVEVTMTANDNAKSTITQSND